MDEGCAFGWRRGPMKRRLLLVAVVAVCALLLVPGAAFAKTGTIKYHGIHNVYVVPVGANLTAGGSLTCNKSHMHWNKMTFEIEKLKGKK